MAAADEELARWRDEHGVVHVVIPFENSLASLARSECGVVIARRGGPYWEWVTYYTATADPPTCIQCISASLRQYVGWSAYEVVGVAVVNPSAVAKIDLPPDGDA